VTPAPACTLPVAGVKAIFVAVPAVTVKVAVALVNPVAEAVTVPLPGVVAVKLDCAAPAVGVTGDSGLQEPDTPLAVNVIRVVAVVTVFPN
jgi:hypothetical protein